MKNKSEYLEKTLLVISLIIVFYLKISKQYFSSLIAIFLLLLDAYSIIKSKDNIYAFFLFLCMLYFDYSIIISKYLSTTPNFVSFFRLIKFNDTMFISISSLYVFHAILILFLKKEFYKKNDNIYLLNAKNSSSKKLTNKSVIFLCALIFIIFIVLIDYLFIHFLPIKRTIYEYLLIPFIIAIYYSKDYNILRKIIFFLILISMAINTIQGGRIVSLQPLLAYVFIVYYNKLTSKKIILATIIGIILFTSFGIYGDLLVEQENMNKLNLNLIYNTIFERKFALDTSISSYWTGTTFIEISNYFTNFDRVKNFFSYILLYTLLGQKSGYIELFDISRKYYLHYYGGFITSYFYFWGGYIGIIFISIYLCFLLNKISLVNHNSSDFSKILFIYLISTLPRWYLYYPTPLFRGIFILYVCYALSRIFIKKQI